MWHRWPDFLRRPIVWIPTVLALAINGLTWGLLLLHVPAHADDLMVLHYTVYFGVDWVGPWSQAFYGPLLGFLFLVGNLILAELLWEKEPMISRFLLIITPVLQTLLFLAALFMVLANQPVG